MHTSAWAHSWNAFPAAPDAILLVSAFCCSARIIATAYRSALYTPCGDRIDTGSRRCADSRWRGILDSESQELNQILVYSIRFRSYCVISLKRGRISCDIRQFYDFLGQGSR